MDVGNDRSADHLSCLDLQHCCLCSTSAMSLMHLQQLRMNLRRYVALYAPAQ